MHLKIAALPSTMIGLKTRHVVCRIMSKVYHALLKRLTVRLKRSDIIREVWPSNDFLKFTRCVRKVIGQGRHFVTFQSSCLLFWTNIDQTLI